MSDVSSVSGNEPVEPLDTHGEHGFEESDIHIQKGIETLSSALKEFERGNYSLFESELPKIFRLYENKEISDAYLLKLIKKISQNNIVEASKLFPLFAPYGAVQLDENSLTIKIEASSQTLYSKNFLFANVEKGLKHIAKENGSDKKIKGYIHLGRLHPQRALEILGIAEEEIQAIENEAEKAEFVFSLAEAYMGIGATEKYKALIPQFDQAFNTFIESMNLMRKTLHALFQVGAALLEKDKIKYQKYLNEAKEATSQLSDNSIKSSLEEKIVEIVQKGGEIFAINPVALHASKV